MFGVEEEREEEVGRLLPGLAAQVRAPRATPAGPRPVPTPEIEEIVERIEHPQRRFPLERAILLSLIAHLLLVIILLLHPMSIPDYRHETPELRARREAAEAEFRVPVKFFTEAPGPSRRNPNPASPPSDKSRVASGGDKSKPRSATPFVAEKSGIEGLQPGPKAKEGSRAASASPASPPSGAQASAGAPSTASPAPNSQTAKNSPGFSVTPGAGQTLPNLNRAIQSAAGNPFAGQGGSPIPNPNGGYVDSGPLSFDTQWYDWGDYAEEMLRRIKLHWEAPDLLRMGVKGKLTIRFYIRADGSVEGEKILRDSTIPPYDHAAFQAIATSSPFRPLPKDLHEDREGVTITFFYNMRPGSEAKGQ